MALNITIKTNGITVTVQAVSDSNSQKISNQMLAEMKFKASKEVLSYTSTINSLKLDMKSIAKKYNYNVKVTIISQLGTDQLPFQATVDGRSMVPTLQNNQNITALKTGDFKVGDIVIACHPKYGLIVKRVDIIKDENVYLKSDNRELQTFNTGITLSDGAEVCVFNGSLDTWQPVTNVIGVVKIY